MKDWERVRGTKQYKAWRGMRNRCNNPRDLRYNSYGGRGITVCERWKLFANFLADMGPRPEGMTLDRIDNNGPYSPENCRWATRKEQSRNTRHNRIFEHLGQRLCMAEWAERFGMSRITLQIRLYYGMSFEDAITKPVIPRNQPIVFNGLSLSRHEWEKRLGLAKDGIGSRLNQGWPLERALSTPNTKRQQLV